MNSLPMIQGTTAINQFRYRQRQQIRRLAFHSRGYVLRDRTASYPKLDFSTLPTAEHRANRAISRLVRATSQPHGIAGGLCSARAAGAGYRAFACI
jgi:hypothetical protein